MSFKESFLLYLCAVLFAGGCLWPGRTAAAAEAPVSVGERGTAARGNAGQYVGLGQALGVSLLKKRQAVLRVGARNFLVEKNDGPGNFAALPAVTVALKRDKTAVGPEVGNPVLVVGGKRRSPVPAASTTRPAGPMSRLPSRWSFSAGSVSARHGVPALCRCWRRLWWSRRLGGRYPCRVSFLR